MTGMRRPGVAALLMLAAAFTVVSSVSAHAELERAEPAPAAVLDGAPVRIDAWFTQELFRREGENGLELYAEDGAAVSGALVIDDGDRTYMHFTPDAPLAPGVYTVRWKTLSAIDGDTDAGEYTFTYDPAAVPQAGAQPARGRTPMAAPTGDTSSGTGDPASSPASVDAPAMFPWWAVIAGVTLLALGGLGAWLLTRPGWRG